MNKQKILKQLDELYLAIYNGEYVFPEFSIMRSKKVKREYSLKAHSVLLRMVRQWSSDGPSED